MPRSPWGHTLFEEELRAVNQDRWRYHLPPLQIGEPIAPYYELTLDELRRLDDPETPQAERDLLLAKGAIAEAWARRDQAMMQERQGDA
jgi:hypothetical protein